MASHCNDCNERVVIDDFYFIELKLFYICNYIKSDVSIQITGALRRRRGRLEPSPPPTSTHTAPCGTDESGASWERGRAGEGGAGLARAGQGWPGRAGQGGVGLARVWWLEDGVA